MSDKVSLCITAVRGRELPAKDSNGKSDPFLCIKVNDECQKTPVRAKTLEPEWGTTHEFQLSKVECDAQLEIECWDKDMIVNDFIGMVKIPLLSLFSEGGPRLYGSTDSEWYALKDKEGNQGEVLLKIGWVVPSGTSWWSVLVSLTGSVEKAQTVVGYATAEYVMPHTVKSTDRSIENTVIEETKDVAVEVKDIEAVSDMTQEGKELMGVVFVDIMSAENLPAIPNLLGTSFNMDPFAVLTFSRNIFKTKVVAHSLSPAWNERVCFNIRVSELNYPIKFNIYDSEKFNNNVLVATGNVLLEDVMKDIGVMDSEAVDAQSSDSLFVTRTFPLKLELNFDTEVHPTITVRVLFCPFVMLRRLFWNRLVRQYDEDGNGKLNHDEICSMLDLINSDLPDEEIEKFFLRNNKNPKEDELEFDELAQSMEEYMQKKTQRLEQSGTQKVRLIRVTECPLCHQQILEGLYDEQIIVHIAVCLFNEPGKAGNLLINNYVTEAQAQKKWLSKVVGFVSYGKYQVGENNGNILVLDRASGQIVEEKMPVYIRMGIRLLYQAVGSRRRVNNRSIKNVLKKMSISQGAKYDDPTSIRDIKPFITFHKLDVDEILDPISSFQNFNQFFYRKLKPEARPIAEPTDPRVCVSPADARCMFFPTISEATSIWVKGEDFTLARLFGDEKMAAAFEGGSMAIFRLAPQDYHRFHMPVEGVINEPRLIQGGYYTVNPMAIRSALDVYGENTRVVSTIESMEYGKVAYVCVGAMMVGSVAITSVAGEFYKRGAEHGYFAFGGSTVLIFFEKGRIHFDADLLENSKQPLETLVTVITNVQLKMGDHVGKVPKQQ